MPKHTRTLGNTLACDDDAVSTEPPGNTPAPLVLRGQTFDAARPAVMAIVNRTTDSFYVGNRHADLDSALAALDSAVALGADIVDIGGVRAGQEGEAVTPEMEIDRVMPFLERARAAYPDLILSLDTWRSEVARAAAHAGVDLVNDTWAGYDPPLDPAQREARAVDAQPEGADAAVGRGSGRRRRYAARAGSRRPHLGLRQDDDSLAEGAAAYRGGDGPGLPGVAGVVPQGLRRRDPRPAGRRTP